MSKRIMVVDDSRVIHAQMQKLLADTDFEVVACCQSGEDALNMYKDVDPDVVTMDILMPGLDGLETLQHLLNEYPSARVIMISSLAYDDTIGEAQNIGAKGFLYKPLDRNTLLEALDKVLAEED